MKQLKALTIIAVLFICSLILQSCSQEELLEKNEFHSFLKTKQGLKSIQEQEVLKAYLIDKAPNKNIQVKDVTLETLTDEEGEFKAIKGQYFTSEGQLVNIVIPLVEKQKKSSDGSNIIYASGGCTMTCTPKNDIGGCEQTIHERCKRQSCECKQPNGECKSSISFNSSS